jgi:hypothetical protein
LCSILAQGDVLEHLTRGIDHLREVDGLSGRGERIVGHRSTCSPEASGTATPDLLDELSKTQVIAPRELEGADVAGCKRIHEIEIFNHDLVAGRADD